MKLSTFLACHGQFIRAEFRTVQKTKASSRGRLLEKQTRGRFRAGCDFSHLQPVKDGIASFVVWSAPAGNCIITETSAIAFLWSFTGRVSEYFFMFGEVRFSSSRKARTRL